MVPLKEYKTLWWCGETPNLDDTHPQTSRLSWKLLQPWTCKPPEAKACHPSLLQHVTALRLQPFQLLPGSSSPGHVWAVSGHVSKRFFWDPQIACKSAAMESTGAVPPSSGLLFLSKKFGGDNVWSSNVKQSLIERGVKVGKLLFLHVNLAVLSVRRLGPCWSQNHEQHQLDVPKCQNTEDQECPVRSTCLLTFMHHGCLQFCSPKHNRKNCFLAKQPTFTTYQSFTNKMVLHGSCQPFNPSIFRPQPLYSDVSHTPW